MLFRSLMGLFGGKAAEVLCRCCEKESTDQDRVGHQVRKEQCAGVMCSVTVVMLFSFIPYGESEREIEQSQIPSF